MSVQTNPRDEFRERIREFGVRNTEITGDDPGKLYVFAKEGGWGIPVKCYDDLDVRLVESIGMEALDESHRLHRPYAHHVLIFKVMGSE